jgi:hypothetical protein
MQQDTWPDVSEVDCNLHYKGCMNNLHYEGHMKKVFPCVRA